MMKSLRSHRSVLLIMGGVFLLPLFNIEARGIETHEIVSNEVLMPKAPDWLKRTRVEKLIDRIQAKLEWSTRRVTAHWYSSQEEFEKHHSLGSLPRAVTIKNSKEQVIHLGPKVNDTNFDWIFSHEMVHIISFQKYKGAIPPWLEEGLANHLAKTSQKVDYKWLATQSLPKDVTQMNHPFQGSEKGVAYHYVASQALAEMLDKKCNLENLIRLSVGRKMENYIETYCGIKDLNAAFKTWITQNTTESRPKKDSQQRPH